MIRHKTKEENMKTFVVSLVLMALASPSAMAAMGEDEFALIAYMRVKPGTEQQFKTLANDVIEASRKESGNIIYNLHQSTSNPQQFVFYELFESLEDLRYHRNAKHTKDFLKKTESITVPGSFLLEEYVYYDGR